MQFLFRQGKYLCPVFGDANRVFKLGGQAFIPGYRCPAIIQDFCGIMARIDHWLDSEYHSRFKAQASTRRAIMQYGRGGMKNAPQPMAGEVPYHGKAILFGMALNNMANIAQGGTGLCPVNRLHQTFIGDLR